MNSTRLGVVSPRVTIESNICTMMNLIVSLGGVNFFFWVFLCVCVFSNFSKYSL